ncbi:ABC transporter ATP-binding protein [Pseudomonas saponiphila]|uniref:Lipopolysaccharide transport system ATP-binding protein n=1 Tax=Pseudomonas saponiphila TaxID=556534 RepID=A0A1H4JKF3_9PSED|nr:ABC transporter ATP-binding protein [Pseudomonas saponiphila]SEB46801.1 lipopolysaccharide transport system ATP-binding protein [Pseudomonas saponiphila]
MSSEVAINVSNLSKCYHIYDHPRNRLKQFVLSPLQRAVGMQSRQYYREFWALRGLSFEVKKGETVGIIGCNGSGKSTLLQMICGILNPTGGEIRANGRIAALLELGSGFNPEFTGRENVYMNASVLGLKKEEVDSRFDDIASFAEIGDFIEQPVKTYSSGMMVRLAFAVIAHVDADILIVDEALSVGDILFTQKCMRFIRKFKEHGTLLFVSHDMGSVLNLCEKVIWLHRGQVRQLGKAQEVSEAYLQYTLQQAYGHEVQLQAIDSQAFTTKVQVEATSGLVEPLPALDCESQVQIISNLSEAHGWKSGAGEITAVQLSVIGLAEGAAILKGGETVRMVIRAVIHQDMTQPILGFLVRDKLGQDLFGENTLPFTQLHSLPVQAGRVLEGEFIFELPMLPNGDYVVMTSLAEGDLYNHVQHHWLHNALILHVASSKVRHGLIGVPMKKITLAEK